MNTFELTDKIESDKKEHYVRSRWKNIELDMGGVFIHTNQHHPMSWSEAYDFTVQREEQIRLVETELEWIIGFSAYVEHSIYGPARERIIAREQLALFELKQGMRRDL